MRIATILKNLRNFLATINILLWHVIMKECDDLGYKPAIYVEKTTIGNLVWHIAIFMLISVAISINICAIIIKIIIAIKDTELA